MYGLQMMQEKDMYVVVHQYCLQHDVHNKCCKYIDGRGKKTSSSTYKQQKHPPKQEHQIKAQWMDVMNENRHVGRQKPH